VGDGRRPVDDQATGQDPSGYRPSLGSGTRRMNRISSPPPATPTTPPTASWSRNSPATHIVNHHGDGGLRQAKLSAADHDHSTRRLTVPDDTPRQHGTL
jgi:hypothetical protein